MTDTQSQRSMTKLSTGVSSHSVPELIDDEIDLRELFSVFWRGKWLIIGCSLFFSLLGAGYAFLQPNIYQSDILLAPASTEQNSQFSSLAGQFGGLASLAGIKLGNSNIDKTTYAIQVLNSRKFIGDFINRHKLLVPLIAVKQWNRKTNTFDYNADLYNSSEEKWVVSDNESLKPTLLQAIKYFRSNILVSSDIDDKKHIITLIVQYYSPFIAQQWATWLVEDLNNEIRRQDMVDAQNSIKYLNEQIEKTSLADTRTMLYQLIEQQTKTLMLTNVRKEYVFRTVDPAVAAEYKSGPKRKLIVVASFIIGAILATFFVFIRQFLKNGQKD